MKAGWEIKPLGELCDIPDSKRKPVTKSDRVSGPYPYYGATGIQDFVADFIFDEPLVLVGEDGAKWESGESTAFPVQGKYWVNNHAHVVRPLRDRLLDNWLIYFLNHSDLNEYVSGLTVPKLNQGSLRGIRIPLAPIEEQRRIVTLLDEAFANITTAKANAEKNLENADALFASALAATFAAQDDSWEEKNIGQWVSSGILAKPQDGNHGEIHPTKADFVETGVPFIMAADLMNGQVDTKNCRFISKVQSDNLRIGFAKSGDVLLSHKGTIGRVAILSTDLDYVMLTPQVTYYRSLDTSHLSADFLYLCLLSPQFQSTMNEIAGAGSTRSYIGITRQMDLKLALPPLSQQIELSKKLRAVESETKKVSAIYRQKLTALEDLKKSLLNQAFSGQI